MKTSEYSEFSGILSATMDIYGAKITAAALSIWCAALAPYSLADVRAALSAHVKNPSGGKFAPKPADLIGLLQANDGRPGVEEAWAMLPKTEAETAVWTEEISSAFGVCLSMLDDDPIAARMAFKEAYAKELQRARDSGAPIKWSVTLGHDPHAREAPLREAVRLGRLPAAHVAGLLPYREEPAPEVKKLINFDEFIEPAGTQI